MNKYACVSITYEKTLVLKEISGTVRNTRILLSPTPTFKAHHIHRTKKELGILHSYWNFICLNLISDWLWF